MTILENIPLSKYTTFHIGGPARYFCSVKSILEIIEAQKFAVEKGVPILVLSGGSNMLVADKGFKGLVIKVDFSGVEVLFENSEEAIIKVASGEVWDKIVAWSVENNLWGLENLSHIPGKTGAFSVQNVGAYGAEASQVVVSVDALDLKTGRLETIEAKDLGFGYRRSIFNTTYKGRYVILYTRMRLSKIPKPNLTYGDLKKRFPNPDSVSQKEIRDAIIDIRNQKFPYPDIPERGNSGSCFKNLILSSDEYVKIRNKIAKNFPDDVVSRFEEVANKFKSDTGIKVPAAFLLDICGLKKLQVGGAKINENQPLVIVNYTGRASSRDVLEIVKTVRQTIFSKTGVLLELEPELIGFDQPELEEYLSNRISWYNYIKKYLF